MNSIVTLPVLGATPVDAPVMNFHSVETASSADADLIELAKQWMEAEAEVLHFYGVVDDMDGSRFDNDRPEELRIMPSDQKLGLKIFEGGRQPVQYWDRPCDIDMLREAISQRLKTTAVNEVDDRIEIVISKTHPTVEQRSRVDEILAAYEKWHSSCERKKQKSLRAAKQALKRSSIRFDRLDKQIHKTRATTIEGVLAKARCAEYAEFSDSRYGNLGAEAVRDLLALHATVTEVSRDHNAMQCTV